MVKNLRNWEQKDAQRAMSSSLMFMIAKFSLKIKVKDNTQTKKWGNAIPV